MCFYAAEEGAWVGAREASEGPDPRASLFQKGVRKALEIKVPPGGSSFGPFLASMWQKFAKLMGPASCGWKKAHFCAPAFSYEVQKMS